MELNSIQELITDIAEGKMIVLMDDEDRENEGDLILAAEKVNPEAINFMATHARGLICLALNDDRCKRLGLEVDIYSRLKGGSWRIKINLHLVRFSFCFFNILKNFLFS